MINLEPHNNGGSFLDSKTILATLIIMASFGGWFFYITKKYPNQPQQQIAQKAETKTEKAIAPTKEIKKEEPTVTQNEPPREEPPQQFDSDNLSFDLTSRGMGIKNITLKKFTERNGAQVELAKNLQTRFLNETGIDEQNVYFKIKKISDSEYVGTAKEKDIEIKKTISIDPEKYLVKTKLEFSKAPQTIETYIAGDVSGDQTSSMLNRNYDKDSVFITYGTNETARKDVDPKKDTILDKSYSAVSVVAIDEHYFTMALVDKSEIMPSVVSRFDQKTSEAIATLTYTIAKGASSQFQSDLYIGPKKIKMLSQVDDRLVKTIDLGYFGWIAKPILKLLKFFYAIFGNYGVAIIMITLLIRLILMPINVSSYRSMKKMQTIQPELKRLKELYKNDQKRLQAETMNVMKHNKVNPLGGCLPMLLQFPIFIALYDVLAQSIELYQAHFVFWIHDLSLKDPYYVLPVLMGISMYLQQKLTPSATMDPTQAKMMQFMPLLFAGLMFSLPSGLNLYIFVSTVFGVLQQYIIMNEKTEVKSTQAVAK